MDEMATAAETIEKLAREAERLRIIQIAEECETLDELIQKLKAKTE